MPRLLPLLLSAVVTACPATSQPATTPVEQVAPDPFQAGEARTTVDNLAKTLEENFVFPDTGKAYAAMLRARLAAGADDSFPDAKAFADRVTDDLQAVHKDGHLRLHVIPVVGAYLGLFPRRRIGLFLPLGLYLQFARVPALLVIGSWFTLQLLYYRIRPHKCCGRMVDAPCRLRARSQLRADHPGGLVDPPVMAEP